MNNINFNIKRALLTLFILHFCTVIGFTKPRTSSEAMSIAKSFIQKPGNPLLKSLSEKLELTLAYTCTNKPQTKSSTQDSYYYVFNISQDQGFIIVSGDDRAKQILGYSDSGNYSTNNLPDNFRNWMAFYQKELTGLFATPETNVPVSLNNSGTFPSPNLNTRRYASSINPLLGEIKWNQSHPYNLFCPVIDSIQTPAGCVATAMAQIMKYYQWPVQGNGKYSYKQTGIADSLKANFGNTTYDWTNMTNTYSIDSPPSIGDTAVATLTYHCGIAVNMMYNNDGSSAMSSEIPAAMSSFFGYDANAQLLSRDYYSATEWNDKLKQELNSSRPVLYGGADIDGAGHQFVCDGYDTNNLYHFNWGWGGHYNGYFELSSLNVETPGIGGGSGGYSIGQDLIVGIQKPTGSSIKTYEINLLSNPSVDTTSIPRNAQFNFNYGFANLGGNTFTGEFAIALYQTNALVTPLILYRSVVLPSYFGNANAVASSLYIPSTIANGFYQIYPIYRGVGETEWKIMRSKTGTHKGLNANVTTSSISFSTPDVYPMLGLTDSLKTVGRLYTNETGRFTASVQNNGGEYNSYLIFALKSVVTDEVTYVALHPVNIPTGTTKQVELSNEISLAPGEYSLYLLYDVNNDQSNPSMSILNPSENNPIRISILESPTTAPIITLIEKPTVSDSIVSNNSDITLRFKVKNTGGFFNNYIAAFIFADSIPTSVDYLGPITVVMDTEEEKTLSLTKTITLVDGKYQIQIFSYNDSTNHWTAIKPIQMNSINFEVVTQTSLDELPNTPRIFPNPAKNVVNIQSSSKIISYTITDLGGNLIVHQDPNITGPITVNIDKLSGGIYLIQIETTEGKHTAKFIKLQN